MKKISKKFEAENKESPRSEKPTRLKLENHDKPVTRREFLAQTSGLSVATVLGPSLTSLIATKAYGLDCAPTSTGARRVAYFEIDLAGGASIAGNVVVGANGSQQNFLPNYALLGRPPNRTPQVEGVDNRLGILMYQNADMLRGIRLRARATTMANVDGVISATVSNDDTGNNPKNAMYWIAKSGTMGTLTTLVGTNSSTSGGNSIIPPASFKAAWRPVRMNQPGDATGLVDLGTSSGQLANRLGQAKAEKISEAIQKMSRAALQKFEQKTLSAQIADLVECGYINAVDLPRKYTMSALDPNLDPVVKAVLPNVNNDNFQQRVGTIAKMVFDGYAGAGTITLGGYDYHTGNRSVGNSQDRLAGEAIGALLEIAARKGISCMIRVLSDGSVAANTTIRGTQGDGTATTTADGEAININGEDGLYAWAGDSGDRGTDLMLVYNAKGSRASMPIVRNPGRQIGSFKESNAVDRSAWAGASDVTAATKAIVANYLALHGEEGNLATIVGDNPFGAKLAEYIMFNKIT